MADVAAAGAGAEHKYLFNVSMSCGGCSGAVERVLKKLEGKEHGTFHSTHSTHSFTHKLPPAYLHTHTRAHTHTHIYTDEANGPCLHKRASRHQGSMSRTRITQTTPIPSPPFFTSLT